MEVFPDVNLAGFVYDRASGHGAGASMARNIGSVQFVRQPIP
ncbi:MAG TPA: hypothetical protein VGP26_17030 [Actinophytocola sp.]|nr:hypothetical protein [Actinophytocola sp.]